MQLGYPKGLALRCSSRESPDPRGCGTSVARQPSDQSLFCRLIKVAKELLKPRELYNARSRVDDFLHAGARCALVGAWFYGADEFSFRAPRARPSLFPVRLAAPGHAHGFMACSVASVLELGQSAVWDICASALGVLAGVAIALASCALHGALRSREAFHVRAGVARYPLPV
jgi:hypothetical protein